MTKIIDRFNYLMKVSKKCDRPLLINEEEFNKETISIYDFFAKINAKMCYLKSGTTGHAFMGIFTEKECEMKSFAIKMVPFPKDQYGERFDKTRPENAEILIIKLLSELVKSSQTPHLTLPILNFNTNIEPFITLIENGIDGNYKQYQRFISNAKQNMYYPEVSILISEYGDQGDLAMFIKMHYKSFKLMHWKVIFFQILSALAVIQSKYPTFRHNDLKPDNIVVMKTQYKKNIKYYEYIIKNKKYEIPNICYQILLWDYDFSSISGVIENEKVEQDWTTVYGVKSKENKYYDTHFFFNSLINHFFKNFFTEICKFEEVKEFIYRIVPKEFQTGKKTSGNGKILVDDVLTTPNKILEEDPFFDMFRKISNELLVGSEEEPSISIIQ